MAISRRIQQSACLGAGQLLLCLAALLTVVACGSDTSSNNGVGEPDAIGPWFNADANVTAGSGASSGGGDGSAVGGDVGLSKCNADSDCTAPQGRCDKGTGKCVRCLVDADCAEGELCKEKGCLPKTCSPGDKQCKDHPSSCW